MKKILAVLTMVIFLIALTACNSNVSSDYVSIEDITESTKIDSETKLETENIEEDNVNSINITIGENNYIATLYDNETTKVLQEKMPISMVMQELHGNEKYYYLSNDLPTSAEKVNQIKTGDIMLFGSNCLVVFYEDFITSYSYTKIGRIENSDGLKDAIGAGSIQITIIK